MRRVIIAGNWKMHKTIVESIELVNALKRDLADIENIDVVVIPPYTALSEVSDMLINSSIEVGAQNVYWEKEGAFTGEVSPVMLKEAGAMYVVIGHSERRQYFNETNETVNKKIKAALSEGLIPIMCVGEKLDEREKNLTFDVVKDHVVNGLKGLAKEDVRDMIIAYEPVWAIGTGKTATPDQAQEVHKYIRGLLGELYDKDTADDVRIQYGGSVKPDNIKDLINQEDIDGVLVGGASLKIEQFVPIVRESAKKGV
ncbi:MAG: triose-phosphate isomerase [Candidatus Omnitrophica bacterium]|nr:triose-phosphate isomerase [Candidatus Omnitrophota bacterium]MBU4488576.1 triose-phosphate isomerase [Candidatus Omnitrophota bacterium]MCG2704456.1 triose-phosphate isomerase [Candidatus Omnitrophota bacterium]